MSNDGNRVGKMKPRVKGDGPVLPDIAKTLWEMILDSGMKAGDRLLPERILSERLGVSRGKLRRGMQSLEERGILCRRHGSGTYVSAISRDEFVKESMAMAVQVEPDLLAEVLEFRRILEPQMAALAAGRIREKEIDELKVIVCNQQLQTSAGGGGFDTAFHLRLAEYSGNRVLFRVMTLINDILAESRGERYQNIQRQRLSVAGHLKIIGALEKKDRESAFLAMREHLEEVEALMLNMTKPAEGKGKK